MIRGVTFTLSSVTRRYFHRMAPIDSPVKHFDYLVIGGGSGGIASARRASEFGATVGLIEASRLGGTCVHVGCVPNNMMFNTAVHAEYLHHDHKDYRFDVTVNKFDWSVFKKSRDDYIKRLNGIHEDNLGKSKVEFIRGWGKFTDDKCVEVNGQKYSGRHTLIATGGSPVVQNIPGGELGMTSDGFFDWQDLPKKTVVVGDGYIAVELAGILDILCSDVSLLIRYDQVLRTFDSMIAQALTDELKDFSGIKLQRRTQVESVSKADDGSLTLQTNNGEISNVNCLIWAIGRKPHSALQLDKVNVEMDKAGHIAVDEYQNTSAPNIYALGDVCGKELLTPVAIAAGRRLAHRVFNNETDLKLDNSDIPTVVFSHPPIGTIGLTEAEAENQHGADNLEVYRSILGRRKTKCCMSLICLVPDKKVIGIHIIGAGSGNMLQRFSVAIKMGATTRSDFDRC